MLLGSGHCQCLLYLKLPLGSSGSCIEKSVEKCLISISFSSCCCSSSPSVLERERESTSGGEGERERERQS